MIFTAPRRPVNRVFLHCSASDHPQHDDVSVIRDWHMRDNGWNDVGYHFYIRKDGKVQSGRNLEKTPAAQAGHNIATIAICLGGLQDFTLPQFIALRALCHEIHQQIPRATFHGHKEVNPNKSCPVFPYKALLSLNARGELP